MLYKGLWLFKGNGIIRITELGFLKASVPVYSDNVNEFQETVGLDYRHSLNSNSKHLNEKLYTTK